MIPDDLVYALKKNQYIVDATDNAAGNLKWDSTTVQTYICPADYRWILLPSHVILDVSGTCVIYHMDSADKNIALLANYTAGTGAKAYPSYAVVGRGMIVILDAGEKILITCGAAQGAGAKASCVVLELRV